MLNVSLAIAGGVLTLVGRFLNQPQQRPWQKHAYLWGALLLCLGAALDHEPTLTAFEVIVVSGCLLAFTKISRRGAAMIIVSAVILVTIGLWLAQVSLLTFSLVGYIGLLCIAYGFATNSNRWLLAGGIMMMVYSGTNAIRYASALSAVFSLLNFCFALMTTIQLRHDRRIQQLAKPTYHW
jgi:hypothetical protein